MAPKKPLTKANRAMDKVFESRGGNAADLQDVALNATRERRVQSAATLRNYNVELRSFVKFAEQIGDLSLFPGKPSKPEDVIRPDAGDLDFKTLHAWIKFRVEGSIGKLGEKVTVNSAISALNRFVAGYRYTTGSKIPRSDVYSTRNFINANKEAWGVKEAVYEKKTPDSTSILAFMEMVLSPDFQTHTNRRRKDILLYISLVLTSASRIGGLIAPGGINPNPLTELDRGLRWGDCDFFVHRNTEDATGLNVITGRFTLRHTKTKSGKHQSYVLTPHKPNVLNGAGWLWHLAIEDEVLVGDPSFEWILNPESLGGKDMVQVAVKQDKETVPLFRSSVSGSTGEGYVTHPTKSMRTNDMVMVFALLSRLCGFSAPLRSHSLRRMMAIAMLESGLSAPQT